MTHRRGRWLNSRLQRPATGGALTVAARSVSDGVGATERGAVGFFVAVAAAARGFR